MKKKTYLALAILCMCFSMHAQDWNGIPVPANAGPGKVWQLDSLSDSFNYNGKNTTNFTSRWKDKFINDWLGPGLTEWRPESSWVSNGFLAISAQRKPNTNKVYLGCISSKQTLRYPLYMEVKAKVSNMVLASDFWLLSPDSTQEIDALEAYGSDRPGQEWFAERVHISHHVFIREPFQDYQPKDPGSWHYRNGNKWRNSFHRYGVYWRDPWHLEYYIDGVLVRTVSGRAIIDPDNFTNGTGLSKAMHAIINTEDQKWRSDEGITPTDAELVDTNKSIYYVDWVRFYKPVNGSSGNNNLVTMSKGNALGFGIDGRNGGANGQNVYLWSHNANNQNQQWIEINRGNGFYSYKKNNTNYCLDGGNGGSNGQNVYLWNCSSGNQNQHWRKVNLGGGKFRLEKRNAPGFSIDGGNGGANGQNIFLYNSNNNNGNQQWLFKTIGSSSKIVAPKTENNNSEELEELNDKLKVNIYPNPTNNEISVLGLSKTSYSVRICNTLGACIDHKTVDIKNNKINISNLASGMYILQLESDNEIITKQFIKR